ncbi:hypothetical protein WH47_11098, partial [Habropoda laboriosa]
RAPGAKIDGPRYKWNGVYNQYLCGGICAPSSKRRLHRSALGSPYSFIYLSNWCVPSSVVVFVGPATCTTRNKSNNKIITGCVWERVVFIIGHCLN